MRSKARIWGAALSALAAVALLGATQAQAKDEFEHAFKYELGRIAAHEAVGAGRSLLGHILLGHGGHGGYQGSPGYPYGYYGGDPGYGHHHGHYYGHYYGHHRGHHGGHHRGHHGGHRDHHGY